MGADRCFSVFHKDHPLHLRKMIQAMGDQEHHLVLSIILQSCKYRILGTAVQCGKRIIQNQDRPGMRKGSRQRQTLCLPAGKTGSTAADDRIRSFFHGKHLVLQCRRLQIRHCLLLAAAEYIILYRISSELRIMPQITDQSRDLPWRKL